jgi:hypothetical protein
MLNKHNFVLKYYDVLYGRLSTYQYPLVHNTFLQNNKSVLCQKSNVVLPSQSRAITLKLHFF